MKTKDGLWKLSPSGLYGFEKCKACFWLENHLRKAPGIPPVLNMAMDSILKARYDFYREKGELPPEAEKLKKEGVKPFRDLEILSKWRGSTVDLKIINKKSGYELGGKIDEVLVEKDGRLIPADFKSSGYAPKADKQKYYILQLNAYAMMFRERGYKVSDRAILLHYFVKNSRNPSIAVEFENHIDTVKIDLTEFAKKLERVTELLDSPYPGVNPSCETCIYHKERVMYGSLANNTESVIARSEATKQS